MDDSRLDQILVLLSARGSVDPKAVLRLPVDVMWSLGSVTAWMKHGGVDGLDFLPFRRNWLDMTENMFIHLTWTIFFLQAG